MKSRVLFILTTLAMQAGGLLAQEREGKNDSKIISDKQNIFIALGDKALIRNEYDSAEYYYRNWLNTSKQAGSALSELVYKVHIKLSQTSEQLRDYEEAFTSLEKAQEVARLLFGDMDFRVAEVFRLKGMLHRKTLNYPLAYDNYQQCLRILADDPSRNVAALAVTYNSIANMYQWLRDFELAKEYDYGSLYLNEAVYGDTSIEVARSSHSLAWNLVERGEYDTAFVYLEKALAIAHLKKSNHPDFPNRVLHDMSQAFHLRGNHRDEQTYLELALDAHKNSGQLQDRQLGRILIGLASRSLEIREYEKAKKYFERALEIHTDIENGSGPGTSMSLNGLAKVSLAQDDYEEANDYLDRAIEINTSGIQGMFALDEDLQLDHIRTKAEVLLGLSSIGDGTSQLMEAYWALAEADSLIQSKRSRHLRYYDKLRTGQSAKGLYEAGIKVALRLYKSQSELKYLETAFRYVENGKSGVLKESNLRRNLIASVIPQWLQDSVEVLRVRQSYYLTLVAHNREEALKSHQAIDSLFYTNRLYDSLMRVVDGSIVNSSLGQKTTEIGLQEIQSLLNERSCLVEYFVGNKDIHVFTITRKQATVHSFAQTDSLTQNLVQLMELVINEPSSVAPAKSYTSFAKLSHGLYNQLLSTSLIEIADDNITNLYIVPDGKLSEIPFEVLISKSSNHDNFDYGNLDYLVNRFNISYAISASMLLEPSLDTLTSPVASYFGLSRSTNTSGFADLRWNSDEIKGAAKVMGGEYLEESQATESAFMSKVNSYSIVHLATHAEIDPLNAMWSRLLLEGDSRNVAGDGDLHIFEIMNSQLNNQMAVLSACRTGSGQRIAGEGIQSFGYAFRYAGVHSVVVTNWPVDDESTGLIVNAFYQNLNDGLDKNTALSDAKRKYLKESHPARRSPFFWAGITLLGNSQKLKLKEDSIYWPLVIGIAIAAIGLIFAMRIMSPKATNSSKILL